MKKTYKIGTRGSLLAVTQCSLIAAEMTKRTGANFELIKIKTQGDAQTDKPLWQMDGKDFFTKELDHALLENEVDLVVHSYKDLGSDRPDGIDLAAITERKYANDILLIREETISQIESLSTFNIGTSSPRRIVNAQSTLKDFLPHFPKASTVECSMLRGNVNTRIQKLKDGNYDAIILALAGLERLAQKEDSLETLKELLNGLNFIVLPQKDFPSSASQGALAIEYNKNKDDKELFEVLRSVHCNRTEKEVKNERALFQSYGGGCHLAVGINTQSHKDLLLDIEKGEHDKKPILKMKLHGVDYSKVKDKKLFLPIGDLDKLISKETIENKLDNESQYFVTSKYCIDHVKGLNTNLWASGSRTMRKLVGAGLWVNGSADSLGHEEIQKLMQSKALGLMTKNKNIKVLSHDKSSSILGEVIPCYKRVINEDFTQINFEQFEVCYWSSFFQYETYLKKIPELKVKIHACGLGKTYDQFIEASIPVTPFASMRSLKEICKLDTKND